MRVPTTTPMFLDRAAEYYSDVVGIVADDGTEYTYREVLERVNRLSNALLDYGLERGDRVALLSPNTHYSIETMFAVQQLSMVFVPLNYRLVPDDYEYLLSDTEASFVIADYEYANKLDGVRDAVPTEHFVCYDADRVKASNSNSGSSDSEWTDYETLLTEANGEPPERPNIDEDDEATINYTSGTTGNPKGAVRTHRTDVWNAVIHAYNVELKDDAVYLWTLPMFHVNGWGAMYAITGVGGTHICLRTFTAERVFDRIQRYDVSYLSGAPTVLNRLLDYHEANDIETSGDNPVTISTAGAAPPKATIEAIEDTFGWELYHFYGHTESGPLITSYSPRRIKQDGRVAVKTKQGIPSIGNEMRVVDANGEDVPRDEETIGEVVLRGNLILDRYWNKPEETKRAFNDRVEGWFHSGDLGTVDENGFVTIKDRKKAIIISGGENISSIEIEDTIYGIPGVQRVAVIPIPHEEWGETPKALLVAHQDSDLTEDDIISHCKDCLASYKAPSVVEFVDELPETATGKLKKYELRKQHWKDEDRMIGGG